MTLETALAPAVEHADDVCSLSLVRRMAALLEHDPASYRTGDPLPRGWHVMLFNPPTAQRSLRADGAASLGFAMPDLGLPRLMMGGRRIEFGADIPIGAEVVRQSKLGPVERKQGRSGSFALVEVTHEIRLREGGHTAVTETSSYVLLPEDDGRVDAGPLMPSREAFRSLDLPGVAHVLTLVPDEPMLFRFSAITDNPHRIHYDQPYATGEEGYPALVVNGSLPQMVLLDMFRKCAGREPTRYVSRNKSPIYCGFPITLSVVPQGEQHSLLAHTGDGTVAIEAQAW